MVQYDAKIIHQFADRLYQQAARIVALSVLLGLIIGGIVGYGLDASGRLGYGNGPGTATIVAALLGALLGLAYGNQRAFMLRFQAQTALCQAQIEANTRSATKMS